jgi:hypothetical protein
MLGLFCAYMQILLCLSSSSLKFEYKNFQGPDHGRRSNAQWWPRTR